MRNNSRKKVIVDTNCWISFLIGKRLGNLVDVLSSDKIELVISEELLEEIFDVTQRPKFSRYFPKNEVESLLSFLRLKGHLYISSSIVPVQICRDAADDYLLELAIESEAHYLVTGDKDLLVVKYIKTCQIIDIPTFESLFK